MSELRNPSRPAGYLPWFCDQTSWWELRSRDERAADRTCESGFNSGMTRRRSNLSNPFPWIINYFRKEISCGCGFEATGHSPPFRRSFVLSALIHYIQRFQASWYMRVAIEYRSEAMHPGFQTTVNMIKSPNAKNRAESSLARQLCMVSKGS
jgi:hypothetical protein